MIQVRRPITAEVQIRPVAEGELALLEECFPEGGPAKHAERLARQQKGEVVYLIAWQLGEPVGHALLNWRGSQDEHVARQLQAACPDIEDLFVLADLRSRGIGRQLLSAGEKLAIEQGFTMIGLSAGAEQGDPARRLYERLGYRDAQFGEYTECGAYVDTQGSRKTWEATCVYLIKDLISYDEP